MGSTRLVTDGAVRATALGLEVVGNG